MVSENNAWNPFSAFPKVRGDRPRGAHRRRPQQRKTGQHSRRNRPNPSEYLLGYVSRVK
jgi:hypothetical protein